MRVCGVGFGGFVAAALDDGLELEAGDCADERGVEDAVLRGRSR